MKIRISVGGTELHLSGLELTTRQVRSLLREVAALALLVGSDDTTEEAEAPRAIGFTAHLELDAERNASEDYWYEDEE